MEAIKLDVYGQLVEPAKPITPVVNEYRTAFEQKFHGIIGKDQNRIYHEPREFQTAPLVLPKGFHAHQQYKGKPIPGSERHKVGDGIGFEERPLKNLNAGLDLQRILNLYKVSPADRAEIIDRRAPDVVYKPSTLSERTIYNKEVHEGLDSAITTKRKEVSDRVLKLNNERMERIRAFAESRRSIAKKVA